jgi:hypothetical protein
MKEKMTTLLQRLTCFFLMLLALNSIHVSATVLNPVDSIKYVNINVSQDDALAKVKNYQTQIYTAVNSNVSMGAVNFVKSNIKFHIL